MVTTSSGAISIGNLRTEFDISGTSGSRALSAFYDASAQPYDDAVHSNTNIPSSGAVALSDFYSTENTYYQTSAPIFYWVRFVQEQGKDSTQAFRIYWNNVIIDTTISHGAHSTTSKSVGGQTYLLHTSKGGSANNTVVASGAKFSIER
jgi:hypothetical protein